MWLCKEVIRNQIAFWDWTLFAPHGEFIFICAAKYCNTLFWYLHFQQSVLLRHSSTELNDKQINTRESKKRILHFLVWKGDMSTKMHLYKTWTICWYVLLNICWCYLTSVLMSDSLLQMDVWNLKWTWLIECLCKRFKAALEECRAWLW